MMQTEIDKLNSEAPAGIKVRKSRTFKASAAIHCAGTTYLVSSTEGWQDRVRSWFSYLTKKYPL